MSHVGRALALATLLAVAACGGGEEEAGRATLWITRDRGSTVLFEGEVRAGLTVMQALRSEADVATKYGGRFVHSIDGIAGSLAGGRDWFYFVNGIEANVGAAEYRLGDGDVAWWDFRAWRGDPEVRVVVGAFPEPFLHGYGGEVYPAVVRYVRPAQRPAAEAIGRLLGAEQVLPEGVPHQGPAAVNVFSLGEGPPRFEAEARGPDGQPVTFRFAGDAMRLARDPAMFRFRYEVP